jgi:hypothetical protein
VVAAHGPGRHGVPTYQGRPDIIQFLSNIFVEQIPWQRYTLPAA